MCYQPPCSLTQRQKSTNQFPSFTFQFLKVFGTFSFLLPCLPHLGFWLSQGDKGSILLSKQSFFLYTLHTISTHFWEGRRWHEVDSDLRARNTRGKKKDLRGGKGGEKGNSQVIVVLRMKIREWSREFFQLDRYDYSTQHFNLYFALKNF